MNEFSNDYWGSKVATYHDSLNNVTELRWKELLGECGKTAGDSDDRDADRANLSFMDNNRALMFDFASPAKA